MLALLVDRDLGGYNIYIICKFCTMPSSGEKKAKLPACLGKWHGEHYHQNYYLHYSMNAIFVKATFFFFSHHYKLQCNKRISVFSSGPMDVGKICIWLFGTVLNCSGNNNHDKPIFRPQRTLWQTFYWMWQAGTTSQSSFCLSIYEISTIPTLRYGLEQLSFVPGLIIFCEMLLFKFISE